MCSLKKIVNYFLSQLDFKSLLQRKMNKNIPFIKKWFTTNQNIGSI